MRQLLFSLFAIFISVDAFRYSNSDRTYTLVWQIINDTYIEATMSSKYTGWLALALTFYVPHENSDMIMAYVQDSTSIGYIYDMWSTSQSAPTLDSEQNCVLLNASQINGVTSISFRRLLNTGDNKDYEITNTLIQSGWAYTTSSDSIAEQHDEYGRMRINFFSGNTQEFMKPSVYYAAILGGLFFIYLAAVWIHYFLLKRNKVEPDIVPLQPLLPLVHDESKDPQDEINRAASPQSLTSKKAPSPNLSTSLVRIEHSRVHLPLLYDMELIVILFALCFILFNVGFVVIWSIIFEDNVSRTLGYVIAVNSFCTVIPVTKNILIHLLGIPFERAIVAHRFMGILVVFETLIHFLLYVDLTFETSRNIYGLIGFMFLCIVYLTSQPIIRRKLFDFFFYAHYAVIGFLVFGTLHASSSFMVFAILSLGIYILDKAVFILWSIYPKKAILTTSENASIVKVRFAKHHLATYHVGQYVFLNFPSVSKLDWHPFSLCNAPGEEELEVNIKCLGPFTKKVLNAAKETKELIIRADGPYGRLPFDFHLYNSFILVSGGIGITPMMSFLRDVYEYDQKTPEKFSKQHLKEIRFIWTTKSESEYAWFRPVLQKLLLKSTQNKGIYPALFLHLHVTGAAPVEFAEDGLQHGRPSLKTIFKEVNKSVDYNRRVGVMACGPLPLINEAWDLSTMNTRDGMRFDFHHEVFEL